jgi:uncharacterized protein (UPF0210 family)
VPPKERVALAKAFEAECFVHGIDYASVGPALPAEPDGFNIIPDILGSTESIFASAIFADMESGLSLSAARACAEVIHEVAARSEDGFANLRFAGLANVPSGSPFFPAAYHRGGPDAIAIATEGAELAVTAMQDGTSLQAASRLLVEAIEGHAAVLKRITQSIANRYDVRFRGIDFSMAPFPESNRSLGASMKALGIPSVGLAGSVAAASFLADSLDQAQYQRSGFSGLFFPILEDSVLAQSAAEGHLTTRDLLLYATVCGTGLDTVPLPGDTAADQLYALLVDMGALALRHDKALTARLMPIPGKKAGDEVHFDFPYFADSRVMRLEAEALGGLLAGDGVIDVRPRPIQHLDVNQGA